jgi:hypothetical protein
MDQGVLLGVRDTLLRHRNADGGWGYAPGKSSRLEPTCWSLLAVARTANRGLEATELDVLNRWKRQDPWLVDVAGAPVNYAFNALAALTLGTHAKGRLLSTQIARALVDVRGLKFEQGKEIRQDNSLQAWPWIESTFSWVEPTCWCLLLLKKSRAALTVPSVDERIDVGQRMLLDRACAAGGWNYGGSNVYGQELFPYVPTTALGLIAMQDRTRETAVGRALAWIKKEALSEPSAHALGLAVIALGVYRAPVPAVEKALMTRLQSTSDSVGILGLATGLFALTRSSDGESPFKL